MSVYIIASYDIQDAAGYEGYVPGVLPLLEKHGVEVNQQFANSIRYYGNPIFGIS